MGSIDIFKRLSTLLLASPSINPSNIKKFQIEFFENAGNKSWSYWVRSKNATSVLCRPKGPTDFGTFSSFFHLMPEIGSLFPGPSRFSPPGEKETLWHLIFLKEGIVDFFSAPFFQSWSLFRAPEFRQGSKTRLFAKSVHSYSIRSKRSRLVKGRKSLPSFLLGTQ